MKEALTLLPILIVSVILHEIAHGWIAMKLGDGTAAASGRLTLNPLPHLDPIGSILIPLMSLAAAGQVFIAWARPVPVNPANFLRPRRDSVLVSAAGPVTNLAIALVCALAVPALAAVEKELSEGDLAHAIVHFIVAMFYGGMYINVVLAVFNLLPVPPLDGSHILTALLPARAAAAYQRIGFVGVLVILFAMRIPVVSSAFAALIAVAFAPYRTLVDMLLP